MLLLKMSLITPPNLIFTMALSLNDMKKKNKGIQGMEGRNSIFKTTDKIYRRLSLKTCLSTDTSIRRIPL